MDSDLITEFIRLWNRYFPEEALPITFEVSEELRGMTQAKPAENWRCFVCDLTKVRNGTDIAFHEGAVSCRGGKRYCGYEPEQPENFRYFLSYGIEGTVEGERYRKTPELVDAWQNELNLISAKGKYLRFKRWDHLEESDNPDVVIFFARPEVISGLFTLANFDRPDPNGVITPMGAGCSSLVHYPYIEEQSDDPRAVLGMMDPSARPCVPVDLLTFAVPMKKFISMVWNMEESFLITPTWNKVMKKMEMSRNLHSKK